MSKSKAQRAKKRAPKKIKKTAAKKVVKKAPKNEDRDASFQKIPSSSSILKSGKQRINTSGTPIKIKVFGIGGGGGNAIARMRQNADIRGIEFIAVNTDAQDLEKSDIRRKVHIGQQLTRGLGTGMDPNLGLQAAEENRADLVDASKGADLIFITAGMGGGTGSGASPVMAEIAREHGALTIAIVTRPFTFEGIQRAQVAEEAINQLKDKVDALIVVPNDRIFDVIQKETPILKAFERIDDVLKDAIGGIAELISSTGIINVDFSDIKAIMNDAGSALIGVGHATGTNRAATAANMAINSPLLEFSIEGAKGILFGISGGRDVKMSEINEIAQTITATIDPGARVIFGAYHDRRIKKGALKVTLIATGFEIGGIHEPSSERLISSLFEIQDDGGEGVEVIDLTESSPRELFSSEAEKEAKVSEPVESRKERKRRKEELKLEEEDPKEESMWDIPAFLRRKKKDKKEEEEQ
ncbi:MAG: cell division protein FtsZ [Candidatus Harrisonbacteria bacterium]|nr:cell division protein FtsZ [Candidatus Harrisonbacteria bacterium]